MYKSRLERRVAHLEDQVKRLADATVAKGYQQLMGIGLDAELERPDVPDLAVLHARIKDEVIHQLARDFNTTGTPFAPKYLYSMLTPFRNKVDTVAGSVTHIVKQWLDGGYIPKHVTSDHE